MGCVESGREIDVAKRGHDQAKAHDNNSGIDSHQHSTVSFIY